MASLKKFDLWAGLLLENGRQSVARMRPVTGEDEAALLDAPRHLLPAEKTTLILTRLLDSIGTLSPVSENHVRQLTIGDRERLVFAICISTFSEEMDLVSRCPFEECGALSEMTLNLNDLVYFKLGNKPANEFEFKALTNDGPLTVHFRIPTGYDQEKAGQQLTTNPNAPVEQELIEACILEVHNNKGKIIPHQHLLQVLKPQLEAAWSALDPASDPFSKINCPECNRDYTALLDGLQLLSTGLENRGDLFEQVHRLARVYHWSEGEVLSLTFDRRQRYLDIASRS